MRSGREEFHVEWNSTVMSDAGAVVRFVRERRSEVAAQTAS
jgi:hypothetical protein